jgi:hypothetical protein
MRIENRAGGGYPDCTIVLGGLPFWVELKASKVKAPAPSCFHLFRGSQAIDLAQKPMSEVRGPRFSGLGGVWDALRLEAVDHFAKFAKSG